MRIFQLVLVVLVVEDFTTGDATPAPNNTMSSSTTPTVYTPDLSKLRIRFKFRVSVGRPYDEASKSALATNLRDSFSSKLADAYKGSPGLDRIEVNEQDIHFRNGNNITCYYRAIYIANENLALIKSDILNRVRPSLNNIGFFQSGTVYNFMVNDAEMEAVVTEAASHMNQTCKVKNFSPCPREYACVDEPYFHCIHRCQYGPEKLMCQNGGRCYVDVQENRTKCSCLETSEYVYSGALCGEKVEKLALKSTYIIAISAGGGGGIIMIMAVLLIVITCKGRAKKNKKHQSEEDGYAMTPLDRGEESNRNISSKLSLDGVTNAFYSDDTDLRFLGGRTHTVLKDEHGQEIYMYKPTSDRHPPTPSMRYSTDVNKWSASRDAIPSRPSSYHGNGYIPGELEIRRPISSTDYSLAASSKF